MRRQLLVALGVATVLVATRTVIAAWDASQILSVDAIAIDRQPDIARAPGGKLFVVWQGKLAAVSEGIYLSCSSNQGLSWQNLGMIADSAEVETRPRIATSHKPDTGQVRVEVVYAGDPASPAPERLWHKRMLFSTGANCTPASAPNAAILLDPTGATLDLEIDTDEAGNVYVVWREADVDDDIRFGVVASNGSGFSGVVVIRPAGIGSLDKRAPTISARGATLPETQVFIAWREDDGNDAMIGDDIGARWSTNGGTSWSAVQILDVPSRELRDPSIDLYQKSAFYLALENRFGTAPADADVEVRLGAIESGALVWQGSTIVNPTALRPAWRPSIASVPDLGLAHVVFQVGTSDVYSASTLDYAAAWKPPDPIPGGARQTRPRAEAGSLYAVWEEGANATASHVAFSNDIAVTAARIADLSAVRLHGGEVEISWRLVAGASETMRVLRAVADGWEEIAERPPAAPESSYSAIDGGAGPAPEYVVEIGSERYGPVSPAEVDSAAGCGCSLGPRTSPAGPPITHSLFAALLLALRRRQYARRL